MLYSRQISRATVAHALGRKFCDNTTVKNFENWLTFVKVMNECMVAQFFDSLYRYYYYLYLLQSNQQK